MVVKNQIKRIKSLQQKKYRNLHGLFVVEGEKSVREFLNSKYSLEKLYTSQDDTFGLEQDVLVRVSEKELKQMSSLHSPNTVLAVFHIAKAQKIDFKDWILVLDDVRDPGNLGTIIRLCDWYGIPHLVCSEHTVDCYNPKVLQATMGSITRINIGYTDLSEFLAKTNTTIYGTFMNGASVYDEEFPSAGILVMGNEANGISENVRANLSKEIRIPQYGQQTTESLNVATATAVFLNEIRRT